MIPDIEELLKTYADWIAWLRRKRSELETQRAKLKSQKSRTETPDAEPVTTAIAGPKTGQDDANALPEAVPPQNVQDLPDWL